MSGGVATREVIVDAARVGVQARDVLVIDLRQLRVVDSLAIGELIAADKRSRDAGRRLTLITAPGPVERLLALAGVDGRLRTASEPPEITEP